MIETIDLAVHWIGSDGEDAGGLRSVGGEVPGGAAEPGSGGGGGRWWRGGPSIGALRGGARGGGDHKIRLLPRRPRLLRRETERLPSEV